MSPVPRRHPRALYILVAVAVCEWFAYWAFRASIMYRPSSPGDIEAATHLYQLYWLATTGVAVVAGLAVDLGGPRRMAIAGGTFLVAALLALALPGAAALYVGFGLVVAGKGLTQVGLTVLVADLYARDDDRRDAGFTFFALAAPAGGFLAPLGTGFLAERVGGWVALAAASAVALAGVIALARWRPAPVAWTPAAGGWHVGRVAAVFAVLVVATMLLGAALELVPPVLDHAPREDLVLLGLHLPLHVWIVVAGAIAALLFPPPLAWLWLRLGDREPSSPAKLALGALISAAVVFLLFQAAQDGRASAAGQLALKVVLVVANLCVWPIALSLISRVAPRRFRGTTTGLWFGAALPSPWISDTASEALAGASFEVWRAVATGAAVAAGVIAYFSLVRLGVGKERK